MIIPNYDIEDDVVSNFRQLYDFMPDRCVQMLICGPFPSGKTNTLMHMIMELLFFDKIFLHAKNLEQSKYQNLMDVFQPISDEVGYDVIEASNVSELTDDGQKLVIFDDFVCDKNQKPLVAYFIPGRHKNCSVIYLSQSYYKTPKDIRLNCSHFSIYDFPSANERSLICRENSIPKESYEKAIKEPYCFVYIDKPRKFTTKNFNEKICNNIMSYSNGLLPSPSSSMISESIRGLPGVGFKLTDDGDYDIDNKKLRNVADPQSNSDTSTKKYVDQINTNITNKFSDYLKKDGSDKMTGLLNMDNRRIEIVGPGRHGTADALTRLQLEAFYFDLDVDDDKIEAQNPIDMGNKKIAGLQDPLNHKDAATKFYIDSSMSLKADKTELSDYQKKNGKNNITRQYGRK